MGSSLNRFRKALLYTQTYGFGRTLYKIAGRVHKVLPLPRISSGPAIVGIIGCGQFSLSTIAYFLHKSGKAQIAACFDIDRARAARFASILNIGDVAECADAVLSNSNVRVVYIASNHASHTDYACAVMAAGKIAYVEKPVAVTKEQLARVARASHLGPRRIYAGYNRPYSAAVRELRKVLGSSVVGGISMNCFVAGHLIDADHWYRSPAEGTRICGNAGHWIDLFLHTLHWRGLPETLSITISSANPAEPDDNFVLTIATDRQDVFSLMLTSRSEPFAGISESIHFQCGDVTCSIDDFKKLTIWDGSRRTTKKYSPKDVGHRTAILQPFNSHDCRDWQEVLLSSSVVLHITDMVRTGQTHSRYSISDYFDQIEEWTGQ